MTPGMTPRTTPREKRGMGIPIRDLLSAIPYPLSPIHHPLRRMIAQVQPWIIYGANGYTGELIAREAVRRGHRPILGGRNASTIDALARELGCESRLFGLDDSGGVAAALQNVALVLHCAAPFVLTSAPMVDACLRAGAHYLDITGEISVFEAIVRRDAEAKARGVTLLPGVGFDVVPTDC